MLTVGNSVYSQSVRQNNLQSVPFGNSPEVSPECGKSSKTAKIGAAVALVALGAVGIASVMMGKKVSTKELNDYKALLQRMGIRVDVNTETNKWILSEFKSPDIEKYGKEFVSKFNKASKKLFGHVEEIKGTANFGDTTIESLANLKKIGGFAIFENSAVRNLAELKEIGHYAYFTNSPIESLGKLEKIGWNADFRNSAVRNLGELKEIGMNADFRNSSIESLGGLEKIGSVCAQPGEKVYNLLKMRFPDKKI